MWDDFNTVSLFAKKPN